MKKFLIFAFVLVLFSCKNEKNIKFDNTEPLSLMPDVSWAIVVNPYVGFQKSASWDSEVLSHARKGDIFQVLGKSFSNEDEVWYEFKNGWLNSSSIQVYSNRLKAISAKKLMESSK